MTYLKLIKKWLWLQAEQMNKMSTVSLKMVKVVILLLTQLVTTVIFFSAWDKSRNRRTIAENQHRCRGPKYLKIISTQVVPLSVSIQPHRSTNGTNTVLYTVLQYLVTVRNTQVFLSDWTMKTFGIGLCKLFSLHHQ
jgi:hypothetical protein